MEKLRRITKFIYVFFIIGLESLGNMSAVTAVLEENLIKKNELVKEEDIIDAVTISRLGPGATTANAVAYLGNKIAGFWGGILATICYTIAPLIVMLIIYSFIERALEYSFVQSALKGCLVYICVLFIKSTIDMGKTVLNNRFNIGIFFFGLIVAYIFKVSCVYIIIGAIIVGFIKIIYTNKKRIYLPSGAEQFK